MTQSRIIVCDIGASSIKIGFAGSLIPDKIIPNLVVYPRGQELTDNNVIVGSAALSLREENHYYILYPIGEDGLVESWIGLEAVLRHSLDELGVLEGSPNNKILITKPYNMKQEDLHQLSTILFSKFKFGAATMHEQAALVLYTQGIETGVVVEVGEVMTTIAPVYKGHAIPNLDKRIAVGGRLVSRQLMELLKHRGYHMDGYQDLETARELKERLCYVAVDPVIEKHLATKTTVLEEIIEIGDGLIFSIGKERYDAVETFFKPRVWGSEKGGLADVIFDTVQGADIDCRVDLFDNIILSGGSSLFPGMKERLASDLNRRCADDISKGAVKREQWKPQVHAPSSRQYMVFEGAALFADLISGNNNFWVTKSEYDTRDGAQLMLDKCN